jgi:uncharacterized protein (TIGR02444 family)
MAELDLDNPAWRYIVALYGRDGVAPECLRLQDEFGIDISFALFCLWLGSENGIALDDASLDQLRRVGGEWAELAVAPLRDVRRAMKQSDFLTEAPVATLRKTLAKLEIEAERIEIALLHRRAGEVWPAPLRDGVPENRRAAMANLGLLLSGHGASIDAAPRLSAALAMSSEKDEP